MLMNETVAIAGAARSPEYWLPIGAQACKEGVVYDENNWVRGSWVQNPVPAKFFISVKYVFLLAFLV